MTITLLVGYKNKGWCEDCWASYSCSNGGLTTALSSWMPRRLSDSGPSAFKSFTVDIRGGPGFESQRGQKFEQTLVLMYCTVDDVMKVGPEIIG